MNITLEAVTKRFGTITAVDTVSLAIGNGELFFMVGPSGCGKTTILRIMAGFCAPDSGQVLFDGTRINERPPHARNTGMVFQNYALWPHLTVAGNVAFGLTVPGRNLPGKERRERVQRMLQAVRMEEFAERKPNQLSGGQQQRVALARALVIEPACLLLDEPLSNLDAQLRLEMRVEIRRLVKRIGITAVYVTHDQEEALSMADRCAILRNGCVEQIGTPQDIYQRPVNRFVADFIGGTNLVRGVIRSTDQHDVRIETPIGEWRVNASSGTFQTGQSVVLSARQEAVRVPPPPDQTTNVFSGTLTETLFFGDHVEYRLAMPDGTEIKALSYAPTRMKPPSAEAGFWIDPSNVAILPDT
ncbi:MAG: ABC transporter ATP-binding protein [Verrucomicrobia bacterium]|nr:ABC transporter ATP-binding protein [Verrucomicrobiota bacterium]MBU4292191.1 ABC transporter ATP-binding protein [Verrucomicrobiota bacterium]MBU4428765.1 ABC transporter ATP-binding protein [Verrucomicrobiota bacterium]MCG2681635.1 ABC transporter ATP-binding protein [Kiritimatiellia bacterium]